MSAERWRYVDSGFMRGAENMACDEAVLEAHTAGLVAPTLRVYGWRPVAISLGKFQRVEPTVDLGACQEMGVEVVRRPTGGRAILHSDKEVTFSLVVSAARLGTSGVMDSYRRLAGGIVSALYVLGVEARLVERQASPAAARGQRVRPDPACFATKARCDLAVGNAKLVGSAQVQRRGFILQQNSLPLRIALADWRRVFARTALDPEAVGLWEAAGREVGYDEVAGALRRGFAEVLGVAFEDSSLTDGERRRALSLIPTARVA